MKKILVILLTIALLLGVVVFPAAADEQSELLGKWDIESFSRSGMTLTKDELNTYGMTMTMDFRADGTVTIVIDGESIDRTYSLAAHTISMAGGTSTFSLSDGKLQVEMDGALVVLTRIDVIDPAALIGNWKLVFHSRDGVETEIVNDVCYEYTADGQMIYRTYDGIGGPLVSTVIVSYELEGNTLTETDGTLTDVLTISIDGDTMNAVSEIDDGVPVSMTFIRVDNP